MYLCIRKKQIIGLIIGFVTICSLSAMDPIVNLSACSLSATEVAELQELASAWQEFYRNNDYRDLMAHSKPFVEGCGIIHELKDISIFRTRQHETACIVDMTKIVGATEPHFHRKEIEVYFILQGTGIVVVGKQEYLVKPGDIVYIPQYLGHFTAPTKDLILGVVNIPYFDKDDLFDLTAADEATRKAVCYDHAQYLRFACK